ncbi:sugar phosphate isomerase/epimerase [Catalinimonas alkaloidigena]|uniref:sugar phosphate isomerase/epimerase family protein n=1 Tax=Catalinimonas alkaloidigena TaxID=1075417 RepID=UPI0024053708|nr:sugar phosphate isomerase/epimerase family protein [Catalinimonas alkaloidigena]MDF9798552.1 sugar phosphate isomerase/epimerase [Catalinimonas alkaloidigena]
MKKHNTNMHNRREFIQKSSLLTAAALSAPLTQVLGHPGRSFASRKFTMQLDGGSIGVSVGQKELIDLASKYGFESVSAHSAYLADISSSEREKLLADMKQKNLVWGNAGLPVQFRNDRSTFEADLKALPKHAEGLEKAGVNRITTWIMPNHPTLNYLQNFREHAIRLREVAKILGDHNIRFGLEYVGPKTLQNAKEYPFMRSMAETKELITAIGEPNVGFVLDSFHWYTAGENVNDILTLNNSEVVACDLNDARSGFSRLEQIDGKRELPMSSGVIDIKGFLNALIQIGFDGPIRAEPFNQELRDMEDEAAVKKTADAMKEAFELVA